MAVKRTGISRDLIIHPGETILEVIEERGITQVELATRSGVSAAYVSKVIAGKKDISTRFAMGLEYALEIPKSFWLNLQANYDAELLEYYEQETIFEEERLARESLKDIVKYLRKQEIIPERQSIDDSILHLRKTLGISNLANLKHIPVGAFRMATNTKINPYVMGAWVRLCENASNNNIETKFDIKKTDDLVQELKQIMLKNNIDIQMALKNTMAKYGIDFSIVMNFKGAPVQGYIAEKQEGIYQIAMTIRGAYADIFWFSLFHELGHIVNGDIGKAAKFLDDGSDGIKEAAADLFASNKLLSPESYEEFIHTKDFSIEAIKAYAEKQEVKPYIVIGRLQKEKYIPYNYLNNYKLRYKWDRY